MNRFQFSHILIVFRPCTTKWGTLRRPQDSLWCTKVYNVPARLCWLKEKWQFTTVYLEIWSCQTEFWSIVSSWFASACATKPAKQRGMLKWIGTLKKDSRLGSWGFWAQLCMLHLWSHKCTLPMSPSIPQQSELQQKHNKTRLSKIVTFFVIPINLFWNCLLCPVTVQIRTNLGFQSLLWPEVPSATLRQVDAHGQLQHARQHLCKPESHIAKPSLPIARSTETQPWTQCTECFLEEISCGNDLYKWP